MRTENPLASALRLTIAILNQLSDRAHTVKTMNPIDQLATLQTRRHFLLGGKHLLGGAALATLLGKSIGFASQPVPADVRAPHFAPKAKRVIYLHMVGGPSQMDLFDYKPQMDEWYDKELPDSIRQGQRLTTMTSGQDRFPVAPSKFKFVQRGECGMWMNQDLLPWLGQKADEICWMRSLHTEAINHEPAIAAMQMDRRWLRPRVGLYRVEGFSLPPRPNGRLD